MSREQLDALNLAGALWSVQSRSKRARRAAKLQGRRDLGLNEVSRTELRRREFSFEGRLLASPNRYIFGKLQTNFVSQIIFSH